MGAIREPCQKWMCDTQCSFRTNCWTVEREIPLKLLIIALLGLCWHISPKKKRVKCFECIRRAQTYGTLYAESSMDDLSVNVNRLTCLSQYVQKHMLQDSRIGRLTGDGCTKPIFPLALTIAASHSFRRSMPKSKCQRVKVPIVRWDRDQARTNKSRWYEIEIETI